MVGTLEDKPLTKVSNSRYEHRLQLANETSNPVKYMIYIYIYYEPMMNKTEYSNQLKQATEKTTEKQIIYLINKPTNQPTNKHHS